MSSFPLSGTVTKAPLLVAPAYAKNRELLHYIKYKLYDAGFIVVREEYRLLNKEIAEKICVTLDYVPEYFQLPQEQQLQSSCGGVVGPSPADMIGTAYIYVLAHRDCHSKLQEFLATLRNEDELYSELVEKVRGSRNGGNAGASTTPSSADADAGTLEAVANATAAAMKYSPVWTNTSVSGAKQAVSLLFPQMMSEDIPTAVQSREYVQATVKSALIPALTDLAKEKPEEPLKWLARRLLDTNTQVPPMISSGNE